MCKFLMPRERRKLFVSLGMNYSILELAINPSKIQQIQPVLSDFQKQRQYKPIIVNLIYLISIGLSIAMIFPVEASHVDFSLFSTSIQWLPSWPWGVNDLH